MVVRGILKRMNELVFFTGDKKFEIPFEKFE